MTRLLSHYWTTDDPPEARQAQIEDWIEDLVDFPIGVVDEACREWRRTQTRRPLPAQIRDLAVQENAHQARLQRQIAPPRALTCAEQWGSCSERWHIRGFICQPECRQRIPDYRTLTDEEAEHMLGPRARRQSP